MVTEMMGVALSDEDLEAVRQLFLLRWTADISIWRERETSQGMWIIKCPNNQGVHISETGLRLCDTIYSLLAQVRE